MFFVSLLYGIVQYPRSLIYRNIGENCGHTVLPSIKTTSSQYSVKTSMIDKFFNTTVNQINRMYRMTDDELAMVQRRIAETAAAIAEGPKITTIIFQFYNSEKKQAYFEGFVIDGVAKENVLRISHSSLSQEVNISSESFIAVTNYELRAGAVANVGASCSLNSISDEQIVALCDALFPILYGYMRRTTAETITGHAAHYVLDNIEEGFNSLKELGLLDDLAYATGAVENFVNVGTLNIKNVDEAIYEQCKPTPTPTPVPETGRESEIAKFIEEIIKIFDE